MPEKKLTADDVLKVVEERDIRFVRLWFTDILGQLKSFSINSDELPDAFAGGNWSRLEALSIALDEWASADSTRGAIVVALDDQIRTACASLVSDGPDSPGARCSSLVTPKPAA